MSRDALLQIAGRALRGHRVPSEAYVGWGHTQRVSIEEGRLRASEDEEGRVGLRQAGHRWLGLGTAPLHDPEAAAFVAQQVRLPTPDRLPLAADDRPYGRIPSPQAADLVGLAEGLRDLSFPRGITITGADIGLHRRLWALASTEGAQVVQGMQRWHASIAVRTGHRQAPGTAAVGTVSLRDPPALQPLLDRAVEIARTSSRPRLYRGPGSGTVLLAPEVVADLIETLVLPALDRSRIARGASPFEAIGAPLPGPLVLRDTGAKGPLLGPRDDEGTPLQDRPLIAEGEVRGDLAGRLEALRHGGEPTGAARVDRAGSPELAPAPRNVVLGGPSRIPWAAAAHEADVVVEEVLGLHTADPATGRFSVACSGGRDGGHRPRGLRNVVLSGTLADVWARTVARAGEDQVLQVEPYGLTVPGLLLEGWPLRTHAR